MNKLQKTLAVQAVTMLLCLLSVSHADAEIRTITATGEYRMGDNDTRTDAKRLALLDAKRLALEQAGTYIESITQVKNFDLTKEEIRAYTAGIVEVVEQSTKDIMEGSTHIIRVDVTAKIDTDAVTHQIDTLRKNETVKKELERVQSESDQLRQKVAAMARALATLQSKAETEAARQSLRQVLAKLEADELVARGWREAVDGKNTTAAGRLARQALALDPLSLDVRLLMGFILTEEHHYEAAIREFRAALRLQPDDAWAQIGLGRALAETGDWPGALAAYRTALRLQPDNAYAHVGLGRALAGTGDSSGAIAAYRRALRLRPDLALPLQRDLALAHVGLARALAETGNRPGALAALRTALRLAPHIAVGLIVVFKSPLRERPDDAWAQIGLGFALDVDGDWAGAIEAFRAGLRLQPDDAYAHFGLGRVLQKTGREKEAAKEFREVLRLASDEPVYRDLINEARAALRELKR